MTASRMPAGLGLAGRVAEEPLGPPGGAGPMVGRRPCRHRRAPRCLEECLARRRLRRRCRPS